VENSVDWHYGLTHLIINEQGLLAFKLTKRHVDDRQPVPDLTSDLIWQTLLATGGYISKKLFEQLYE